MFRLVMIAFLTKRYRRYVFGLVCILFLCAQVSWAQTRASLSMDRGKLNRQLALTERLLSETMDRSERSLVELSIINKQILLREQLVANLNRDIGRTNRKIDHNSELICTMETDIQHLKEEYARTANMTYRSINSENFWLSVLSAENLSEAYYRGVYFRQFSQFRKRQVEQIKVKQLVLEEKSKELGQQIQEKKRLLGNKSREANRLKQDKAEQAKSFDELKIEEKGYRTLINQQRAELKQLIGNMDSQFGTKVSMPINASGMAFEELEGKLPWPVPTDAGIIVGEFGITEDPYGNRIENDGIYIRTPQGQVVRAVHTGKVTGVQRIPMSGLMVILEHGPFRSVYANLEYTDLQIGDLVDAETLIGTVRTDVRNGETLLNFLIYQIPDTFVDPEEWITGK